MTTLYENNEIKVIENGSQEIIIKRKNFNCSIRVSSTRKGLQITSSKLICKSFRGLSCVEAVN